MDQFSNSESEISLTLLKTKIQLKNLQMISAIYQTGLASHPLIEHSSKLPYFHRAAFLVKT